MICRKHVFWWAVAGAAINVALLAAENKPAAPPREHKIRVLIITGGHPFEREPFFEMFAAQPDLDWQEAEQPQAQQWFTAERAEQYDVLLWYDFGAKIGEEARNNLLALLNKGKPLLILHHAIADYPDWPEASKIIGAKYYLKAQAGRPRSASVHDQELTVKIADPRHPITRFMGDFKIRDEVYSQYEMTGPVTPLLTAEHPQSAKYLGWTHLYGKSQVVYLQGGHDHYAYVNPSYRRLVMQSIRWLAGALPQPDDEGFVPLFNGRDFDGWTIMGDPAGWKVENGLIRSELGYKGKWIRTNKVYEDFILRVQWRVSQNGNSGVFVHSNTFNDEPWENGCEIQITNFPRDDSHCTGALYSLVPVNPRPDESAEVWHEQEIQCRGPFYKVFVDGLPVIDVDARKVPKLNLRPRKGYIGLQDNHSEHGFIEFRNVRVQELPPMESKEPPWRLAIQAWTFNDLTLYETIDLAKKLGVRYLEAYPGQKVSPQKSQVKFDQNCALDTLREVRQKLNEAGVQMVNFGVAGLGKNEAEIRKLFDFALLMGIETIVSEPDPAALPLIDQLANEYRLNVAIHNHPKPSRYWDPDFVLSAVGKCSKRIGVCADTGHWMRSEVNPREALAKLRGRIISLHFKDLDKFGQGARDLPWGRGVGDAQVLLAELKKQQFAGVFSLEYEHKSDKLVEEVSACIEAFNRFAKELGCQVEAKGEK